MHHSQAKLITRGGVLYFYPAFGHARSYENHAEEMVYCLIIV